MGDEPKTYDDVRSDLLFLSRLACRLSLAAAGKPIKEWSVEQASHVFTKICVHSVSVIRLAPRVAERGSPTQDEIWDLPSICTITRSLIDSVFVMRYLAIESVSSEEREFRELSWHYHERRKRIELVALLKPTSELIDKLKLEADTMLVRLRGHPQYALLTCDKQKQLRKACLPIHRTNSDLCEESGISASYYKVAYRFLSNYVHTHPYALAQLNSFKAGDAPTTHLFRVVLEYCQAFLSLAIRDYWGLMPDVEVEADEETVNLMKGWIELLESWDLSQADVPS